MQRYLVYNNNLSSYLLVKVLKSLKAFFGLSCLQMTVVHSVFPFSRHFSREDDHLV